MEYQKTTVFVNGGDADFDAYIPVAERFQMFSETGQWECNKGKYCVNLSTVLTKLIQEAGRWCEAYASDLFIEWRAVERHLEKMEDLTHTSFVFGMRRMGVDNAIAVFNKTQGSSGSLYREYRAVWCLDVKKAEDKLFLKFYIPDRIIKVES